MAVGQETTPATDESVVDAAGSVLNSPRIVGGQDVTDRTQYAYQVGNCGTCGFIAGKIDKIEKQLEVYFIIRFFVFICQVYDS